MIKKVEEKIKVFAEFLKSLNLNFNLLPGVEKAKNENEARNELTLLFYVDAICHQTQNFYGEIDGVFLKGWDYLLQSFKKEYERDNEFIKTKRMKKIKGEDVKRILNGSGDRYYERAYLLRNCAYILERDFKGDIFEINRIAEGYIKRERKPDLIKLFHKFKAYSDPLNKKTYLFINIAKKIGFWEIKDPENLWTPVDYHLERVILRIGIVDVDETIKKKLIFGKRVPLTIDLKLREKIGDAVKEISNLSGISVEKLDQIFWSLGRSICFKYGPSCDCIQDEKNTFTDITGISLKDGCPFRNFCNAYKISELKKLKESNVFTIYY
jgi:hypothetical protein